MIALSELLSFFRPSNILLLLFIHSFIINSQFSSKYFLMRKKLYLSVFNFLYTCRFLSDIFFLPEEVDYSYNAGLLMMNSLSFHLPEKKSLLSLKKKSLLVKLSVFYFIFIHIFFHIAKIRSDVMKVNEKKISHG